LVKGKDKQVNFTERVLLECLLMFQNSEISDELYKIDDAMKAGFGWENGPFEIWDAIELKMNMKAEGLEPAAW
jgi:3-hydroxyacyl-CoA dehydrogenase